MRCRSCSLPVSDGARFCQNCGLPQLGAVDEERRVVTVLFADIAGFTTLAEGRDPERVKRVVDELFIELRREIEAHGGLIDKVLGDGIVALFGAPIAHEDDPERAVRAGLAMQTVLVAARADHPADVVRMRIGINTGEVLVGTIAGTDYTAMGDAVNTAARLQELAPVDGVLVGDSTRAQCSDAIRFRRGEVVSLRGRATATVTWIAESFDGAARGRRTAAQVAFVGRRPELAMLDAVRTSLLAGRAAVVSITGEAGIGKTRLVAELVESIVDVRPMTTVVARGCAPYGDTSVWWPVAGGILEDLDLDQVAEPDARACIADRLAIAGPFAAGSAELERAVELVLHVQGLPSTFDRVPPEDAHDAVVQAVVAWLERSAATAPVVLWIDDVQWASRVVFDLLRDAVRQVAHLPVVVATTARSDPDAVPDWPPVLPGTVSMALPLEPLPPADAVDLVRRAAGGPLAGEAIDTIILRSGGNPLYLIELARATVRSGGELPVSLRAVISARLDQLSPGARRIVDNAAILGNEGRILSLEQFADELDEAFDRPALAEVADTGLLDWNGDRWRFRSDIVREVAYETLTKQARAQRHAGVARYLRAHEPQLVDRRAHHAATAAELVRELGPVAGVADDIRRQAAELLLSSAGSWLGQGAARRAEQAAQRGLGLAEPGSAVHRRLLLARANAVVDLHELPRARSLLGELVAVADGAGDRPMRAEVHRLQGEVDRLGGDLVASRRHLAQAVDEFRALGDEDRLTEAILARGFAEIFGGSLAEAERFLGDAERRSRRAGDTSGAAWALQHRAWVAFVVGDHRAAEELLAEAGALFRQVGDRRGRAWSYGLLGYVMHFNRRDDEALRLAHTAIEESFRWGDEWGASMMRNLVASVALWRGELAAARESSSRALSGFRRIDDRFGMLLGLATFSRASIGLGHFADAERSVEEIVALAGSFGALAWAPLAAAGAEMHLGRGARARELAQHAVERLDLTGASLAEATVVVAFGQLLSGDPEAALATLDGVQPLPFARAARATASALVGDAEAALADADAVAGTDAVGYWDDVVVTVAAAVVDPQRRRALRERVDRLDDVVVAAYARRVLERVDGRAPGGGTPIGDWAALADALAAVSPPGSAGESVGGG